MRTMTGVETTRINIRLMKTNFLNHHFQGYVRAIEKYNKRQQLSLHVSLVTGGVWGIIKIYQEMAGRFCMWVYIQ